MERDQPGNRRRRGTRRAVAVAVASVAALFVAQPAADASGDTSGTGRVATKPALPAPAGGDLPGAGRAPAGFASWAEVMRVQRRLNGAADRIVAAQASGFAGIVVSAEKRRLDLYWKGRPTQAGLNAIAAARRDATVRLHRARYSERELLAAAQKLTRQAGVTAITPNVDGSGLSVSVRNSAAVSHARVAAVVPVTRVDIAAPTPMYSRGNDAPPYWGGARWNGCSTGFAIAIGGASKMLSAGHCGGNGGSAFDGGGDYMGTISGDSDMFDRLYINTWSAGRIYDGGVGSGEFSKPVVGAARSYVGDWLCTSGAYSGARCGIQVKAVNQFINVGYWIALMVRAEHVYRESAAGNGDSGGPVFSLPADTSKVIAKGTISAGDPGNSPAVCTGVPSSSNRRCSWRIWYADIANSLTAYGASIITG